MLLNSRLNKVITTVRMTEVHVTTEITGITEAINLAEEKTKMKNGVAMPIRNLMRVTIPSRIYKKH